MLGVWCGVSGDSGDGWGGELIFFSIACFDPLRSRKVTSQRLPSALAVSQRIGHEGSFSVRAGGLYSYLFEGKRETEKKGSTNEKL